jgi:PEP-CTERM motif
MGPFGPVRGMARSRLPLPAALERFSDWLPGASDEASLRRPRPHDRRLIYDSLTMFGVTIWYVRQIPYARDLFGDRPWIDPGIGLYQFGLTAPFGALVGEINGVYEELGTSFSGPAWATGTLYLFYWDFNAYDNSGSVNVNISPGCAVPEPATWTMMLLGMGTIGFLARGRRVRPVTLA